MSSLLQKLKKSSTVKLTSVMEDSKFFNNKDVIKTDLPILNLALSGSINGGLSSGLTVIAAPSRHYKSNLALFMVAAYLKKYPDAICLFYDSEFGSPPDYLKTYDIDLGRVLHTPVTTIEELRTDLTNQLDNIERGEKVIIFIDSVGNLASRKETVDAMDGSEKSDLTRARVMKSLFRIVTPQITLKEIPCVVINHVYQEMSMYGGSIMGGGCVVEGTKIQMQDGSTKSIQDIQVGEYVKTLTGSSEVTNTWNPETLVNGNPICYELEFDDGFKVITSETHKFLCSEGDQFVWVEAKDLTSDYDVVCL